MRVIVTTGSTREPIDAFRLLTAISTGRFGYEIARSFHGRGFEVVLLAPDDITDRRWYELPFAPRPFTTVADLAAKLRTAIEERPCDALLMAAAVADYRPLDSTSTKLSSDPAERDVRLVRTPKILTTLRRLCGPSTYIVGFKLMIGVPEAQLKQVAESQTRTYSLDLTVANDLARLRPDHHLMFLSNLAGDWVPLSGDKRAVADQIVQWICAARPAGT